MVVQRLLRAKYIFGDYDLYGLIDLNDLNKLTKQFNLLEKIVKSEMLLGEKHFFSSKFSEVQFFLKKAIGEEMIQHGSQDIIGHKDDKVYIFTPSKQAYAMKGTANEIREAYKLLFKEEPIA